MSVKRIDQLRIEAELLESLLPHFDFDESVDKGRAIANGPEPVLKPPRRRGRPAGGCARASAQVGYMCGIMQGKAWLMERLGAVLEARVELTETILVQRLRERDAITGGADSDPS